jgi:alkylation response protein AidB-like acyl-CoA dehydrogenase
LSGQAEGIHAAMDTFGGYGMALEEAIARHFCEARLF